MAYLTSTMLAPAHSREMQQRTEVGVHPLHQLFIIITIIIYLIFCYTKEVTTRCIHLRILLKIYRKSGEETQKKHDKA